MAHQHCYGASIHKSIPSGDWLCNNCRIFGSQQAKRTVCALCTQTGGFMRITNVFFGTNKHDESITSNLMKPYLRKEAEHFDKYWDEMERLGDTQSDKPAYKQLYWWVHLSCARWILFDNNNPPRFSDKRRDFNVQCLAPQSVVTHESLDFKRDARFKDAHCVVCNNATGIDASKFDQAVRNKTKGITIRCSSTGGNCPVHFHVECARRAKYHISLLSEDHIKNGAKLSGCLEYREHTQIMEHGAICGNQFSNCDLVQQQKQRLQIFCLKHRPFELPKEMLRRRQANMKTIQNFVESWKVAHEISKRAHWTIESLEWLRKLLRAGILRVTCTTIVVGSTC